MRRDLKYRFTSDWTSMHFDHWKEWFAGYVGKPDVKMLEIGTYEGRSAFWFVENVLTGPGAGLTCVDTWADRRVHENFLYNVQKHPATDRIVRIKNTSDCVPVCYPNPYFDIAYVDGNHDVDWVLHDAINAWGALKPGGLCLFDDYGTFPGVHDGTGIFFRDRTDFEIATYGHQLLVRKLGSSSTEGNSPAPKDSPPEGQGNGPKRCGPESDTNLCFSCGESRNWNGCGKVL